MISGMPIFRYFPGFFFFRYFWPDPKNTCMLIFSIFSYFIFLFLNFLSLFVFIFCETARTRRFSVIFAKVQWHPCDMCSTPSVIHLIIFMGGDCLPSSCCRQACVCFLPVFLCFSLSLPVSVQVFLCFFLGFPLFLSRPSSVSAQVFLCFFSRPSSVSAQVFICFFPDLPLFLPRFSSVSLQIFLCFFLGFPLFLSRSYSVSS